MSERRYCTHELEGAITHGHRHRKTPTPCRELNGIDTCTAHHLVVLSGT
jgi:hypothetical protein